MGLLKGPRIARLNHPLAEPVGTGTGRDERRSRQVSGCEYFAFPGLPAASNVLRADGGHGMDNVVKTIYLDLAAQWRVLARQAEMWDMDRDGQLLRILSDAGRRLRGD